jgi:hypothetical protein
LHYPFLDLGPLYGGQAAAAALARKAKLATTMNACGPKARTPG